MKEHGVYDSCVHSSSCLRNFASLKCSVLANAMCVFYVPRLACVGRLMDCGFAEHISIAEDKLLSLLR